ncbi:non-ribosomal peptide synthetase [Pedobacter alluvionis]|uniref:Amino acid adenylation domain-containing protein n=1 Tax=Pedobacter alluvionis TaxID=475253 RepID=A0A497XVM3_9SPHI|nr:non-ribosomal peptide synthetase [Pedobacter alluvionis]RLJ72737.1 iturin family lipopeptide synthetase B [Pedobacter alluvionis]TFB29423.1 amino acid adenylation domain-containing protein [Pedobacter alluvionis]
MIEDVYMLSPLQQGLYFRWLSDPDSVEYFIQTSYTIKGELDIQALEQSYAAIIERYAILRTFFTEEIDDKVLQIVRKDMAPDFRHIQVRPGDDVDVKFYREADRARGFNLHKGPLMRFTVLERGAEVYEFIWSFHHILMDGWCGSILIKEFFQIYNGKINGKSVDLGRVYPYSGYINWLSKLNSKLSLNYWKTYLASYDTTSVLPKKVMGANQPYQTRTKSVVLDTTLRKAVKEYCIANGITENTFVSTAWGLLLALHNVTSDVVFGSVVSGRPPELKGVEGMIGLFSNAVPVRVTITEDINFNELTKAVQQHAINGTQHHYVQLAEIQAQSVLGRDLFDHILVFENFPVQKMIEEGINDKSAKKQLSLMSFVTFEQSNYDFTLTVLPAETMIFRFSYNGSVYDSLEMEQLAEQFLTIIKQVIDHPSLPLHRLEYVSTEERKKLLYDYNPVYTTAKQDMLIPELIKKQALRTPDAIALSAEGSKISYRQLDEKSDQLAYYLKSTYAVKPDFLVGVLLDRSINAIIAILGIWKAGGAYVPIDPDYPESRRDFILKDTGLELLITQTDHLFKLQNYEHAIFAIDLQLEGLEISADSSQAPLGAQDLAYVIYTSGSTGRPKGVMIDHGAISNTIYAQLEIFQLSAADRGLQFASLSFDASVWEIFMILTIGGCLYLATEEEKKDPELLEGMIKKNQITIATLPPAIFRHLHPENLRSIKKLITAGESAIVDKSKEFATYGLFYNGYGPTESSVCTTIYQLNGKNLNTESIPIGKPIRNTSVYILNHQGNMVPAGVIAEVYITGKGLARGYFNQPGLTKEKFVSNPFQPGTKMYRTGDLGRWLADGNIEFLGRADDQVKISGYRVELGEIENNLQQHTDVDVAAVIYDAETKMLTAFYSGKKELTTGDLRGFLSLNLPVHMIPSAFVHLDEFPITSNGKTDKKKLAAIERFAKDNIAEYERPVNHLEQLLVDIYAEVLLKKQVRLTDDFFALGGDSIKSIQVVSKLKQKGYSLKIQDVLSFPVVTDLVKRIDMGGRVAEQTLIEGQIPLSPIQSWFLQLPYSSKHHYNQSVLLKSTRPIDKDGLRAVFNKIVIHHDALRMVFKNSNGEWLQENKGIEQGFYLEVIEVASDTDFAQHCSRVQSGLDLENGPLFKVVLFPHPDGDRLLLVAHHLIIDGVSWRILFEEMSLLYTQFLNGNPLLLPLKTDSFKYWQEKQLIYAQSELLQHEVDYWMDVESQQAGSLIPDYPQGSNLVSDVASVSFSLNEELTERLIKKCYLTYQTEVNDILLTALSLALKEAFGLDKIAVKMEGHGREDIDEDIDVNRTVGWFTTVFPVIFHMNHEGQTEQLLHVRETLRRVPNKGIGYGILRYLAQQPFVFDPEITFNYLGDFGEGIVTEKGDQLFEFSSDFHGRENAIDMSRDSLLDVSGMIIAGTLRLSVKYSTGQFKEETLNQLIGRFRENLLTLIDDLSNSSLKVINAEQNNLISEESFQELTVVGDPSSELFDLSYNQLFYLGKWELISPVVVSHLEFQEIDVSILRLAVQELVARHEILRTVFVNHNGKVKQKVIPVSNASVAIGEVVVLDEDTDINFVIDQEFQWKFKLSEFPLMRILVFKTSTGKFHLIFNLHHIITDGYSRGILHAELLHLYQSMLKHEKHALKELLIQYKDFVSWQSELLMSTSGAQLRKYWLDKLSGFCPVLDFNNTDQKMDQIGREAYSFRLTSVLSGSLFENLNNFSEKNGLTRSSICMGTLIFLLHQLKKTNDVTIGTAFNGRSSEYFGELDVSRSIGYFVNALFVRNIIHPGQPGLAYFQSIQENFLNDLNHSAYPFTKLVSELPDVQLSADFLDQMVFFNYHNYDYLKEAQYFGVDETAENVEDTLPLKGNFGLTVWEYQNCLKFEFMCHPAVFDKAQRQEIKEQYYFLLQHLMKNSDVLNTVNL